MGVVNDRGLRPRVSYSPAMKRLMVIVNIAVLTTAAARFPEEVSSSRDTTVTASTVKDGSASETPWLHFLQLNSFPSFGLQGLRPKPIVADKIKATKTEYFEVTRRQTVHPMCYTTYENKAPCLPYRSHGEEEEPEMDLDIQHQISEGIHAPNEMESYMKPVREVLEGGRGGKYLEFGNRPKGEIHHPRPEAGNNRETEYVTTTVLLTKLERYTDHRVTATMVALNCFPVDPAIPKCRRYVVNPIIEVPLYGKKNGHKNPILITPVIKPKSDNDEDVQKTVDAVKKAAQAVRAQTEEAQESGDPAADVPATE